MKNGSIITSSNVQEPWPHSWSRQRIVEGVDIQGQPSVDWPSQKPLWLVELLLPIW